MMIMRRRRSMMRRRTTMTTMTTTLNQLKPCCMASLVEANYLVDPVVARVAVRLLLYVNMNGIE